jgi:hypothetical protein
MNMKTLRVVALFVALFAAGSARAAVVYMPASPVVVVETTYFPSSIVFRLASGESTNCPTGKMLYFSSTNVDSMKAMLAVVMASYLSGKSLYAAYDTSTVNTGTPGYCRMTYIGLQ